MFGEKTIKHSTKPAQSSSSSLWLLFCSISMLRKGIVKLELCLSFHRSREADSSCEAVAASASHVDKNRYLIGLLGLFPYEQKKRSQQRGCPLTRRPES